MDQLISKSRPVSEIDSLWLDNYNSLPDEFARSKARAVARKELREDGHTVIANGDVLELEMYEPDPNDPSLPPSKQGKAMKLYPMNEPDDFLAQLLPNATHWFASSQTDLETLRVTPTATFRIKNLVVERDHDIRFKRDDIREATWDNVARKKLELGGDSNNPDDFRPPLREIWDEKRIKDQILDSQNDPMTYADPRITWMDKVTYRILPVSGLGVELKLELNIIPPRNEVLKRVKAFEEVGQWDYATSDGSFLFLWIDPYIENLSVPTGTIVSAMLRVAGDGTEDVEFAPKRGAEERPAKKR